MNITRSPSSKSAKPNYTGSQPDLSSIVPITDDRITLRNKRKLPTYEDDICSKSDIMDFRKEMMSFLQEFRTAHDEDMKGVRADIGEIKNQVNFLKNKLEKCDEEHAVFTSELSNLKESVDLHSKQQDELKLQVTSINADINKLKTTEQELADCKSQLANLQNEHNVQQQRERLNNIEITGITEKSNENVSDYLISICQKLGIILSVNDILQIHRVPTRVPNKPKNIVAKMRSQSIKDSIISAMRKKKNLTTDDINVKCTNGPSRIYVNEHLTPFYKNLHKKTREYASSKGYQFVWIRNCKIFVRKNDNSASIFIQSHMDLAKLK